MKKLQLYYLDLPVWVLNFHDVWGDQKHHPLGFITAAELEDAGYYVLNDDIFRFELQMYPQTSFLGKIH